MSLERTSHTVDRLGGEVRYDIIGDGPSDVVCWPGGTRPLDDLIPLAEHLARLADVRMILVQPRGCPGNTLPLGGHTLADLSGDVTAVLDGLHNGPAVLVGHAFGNRVMRMSATLRPDLVHAVVLFAAGGMVGSTDEFFAAMKAAQDRDLPMEQRVAAFGRAYFEEGATDPMLWWKPPTKLASITKQIRAEPIDVWWSGGTVPMLVVQGALDQSAPPGNGEALAADHPDRVTLHTIEGAAHTLPIDRPVQCAQLVADWLHTLD